MKTIWGKIFVSQILAISCLANPESQIELSRKIYDWTHTFHLERVEATNSTLAFMLVEWNKAIQAKGGAFKHIQLSASEAAQSREISLILPKEISLSEAIDFATTLTGTSVGYTVNEITFYPSSSHQEKLPGLIWHSEFVRQDREKKKNAFEQAYTERLTASTRTWKSPVPLKRISNMLPTFEAYIEEIHKIQDLPPLSESQIRVIRSYYKPSYVDIDLKKGEKTTYGWPEEPRKEALSPSDIEWLLTTLKDKTYQNVGVENTGPTATSPTPPPIYIIESKLDGQHLIKIRYGLPRAIVESFLLRILTIADPLDEYIQNRLKR